MSNKQIQYKVYARTGEPVSWGNTSVFFDRPPTFEMWSRIRSEILGACIAQSTPSRQRQMQGGSILFVNTQEVAVDEGKESEGEMLLT